jgi:hypothetical protein
MPNDLFEFSWLVPERGYELEERVLAAPGNVYQDANEIEQEKELVITDYRAQGSNFKVFRPLHDYPALFRTFAATPTTQEGVLSFANRYGMLGIPRILAGPAGLMSLGSNFESLRDWVKHIQEIKQAVNVWDMVSIADIKKLQTHVQWSEDNLVFFVDDQTRVLIASPRFHPELLERIPKGNVFLPSVVFLNRFVNERLREKVDPRLLLDVTNDNSRTLRFVPATLLSSLWLQLAEAISAKKKHRQCAFCQQWFEVEARGVRSDKQFCSGACRTRAYRARNEKEPIRSGTPKKQKTRKRKKT